MLLDFIFESDLSSVKMFNFTTCIRLKCTLTLLHEANSKYRSIKSVEK